MSNLPKLQLKPTTIEEITVDFNKGTPYPAKKIGDKLVLKLFSMPEKVENLNQNEWENWIPEYLISTSPDIEFDISRFYEIEQDKINHLSVTLGARANYGLNSTVGHFLYEMIFYACVSDAIGCRQRFRTDNESQNPVLFVPHLSLPSQEDLTNDRKVVLFSNGLELIPSISIYIQKTNAEKYFPELSSIEPKITFN